MIDMLLGVLFIILIVLSGFQGIGLLAIDNYAMCSFQGTTFTTTITSTSTTSITSTTITTTTTTATTRFYDIMDGTSGPPVDVCSMWYLLHVGST